MDINEGEMLPITNKKYMVMYKNEYDQVGTLEGMLVHPDVNGFIVFDVNKKRIVLPKDRIFSLREIVIAEPPKAV
jgi:hypothetical protein